MIGLTAHFKFYWNSSPDFRFHAQIFKSEVCRCNLICFLRCFSMRRCTESQFLLYMICIVNFNRMTYGIGGISQNPPMACLFHKITISKLLILFFCHIAQCSVCLTAFLHLHGPLEGRTHTKRKRGNSCKQKRCKCNR